MTQVLQRYLFQRIAVRNKSTHPVKIGIEELRFKKKTQAITNGSIALRDYYEWHKLSDIMVSETFFTHRGKCGGLGRSPSSQNDLLLYDPIMTHCIAKWLLVNYKLNSYPYHDLNIVNIYADLRQSLQIAKTMMTYFKAVLSDTMFERIRFIMVPLYDHKHAQVEKIRQEIPGEIELITDDAIFLSQGQDGIGQASPLVIEDPVSIIMLNDVMKNLSHDVIKYSYEKNKWEQGYLEFDSHGNKRLEFQDSVDFWCKFAIENTLEDQIPSRQNPNQTVYIPTRLAQLFEMIRKFAPQHRFFAVDEPQRWNPSVTSMLRLLLGYNPIRGSKVMKQRQGIELEDPVFMPDFTQVQQMYMNINGMGKISEINDLGEFVDKWVNLGNDYKNANITMDQLVSQLKMINESTLATIHSN
ncbi:hypothetical protein HG535_0F05450 [Zygotorulaspora mrakii]|uniref:type II protein arginine methyltransferase n=1 Tax=Zygotorulaspora mrakii TaxID=42260 RepID=A0A7H9B6A0_ZYGMR|nr:uncharacterized protein HG535_0F05450 [Zygotorulaspora mrakii]QLG74033.1 hypothetical protein HG535_0F05450 [Zygotorulaspora mrakii]